MDKWILNCDFLIMRGLNSPPSVAEVKKSSDTISEMDFRQAGI